MQRYPTVVRKNFTTKEGEEHPHNGGHTQAKIDYLKSFKHTPYVGVI